MNATPWTNPKEAREIRLNLGKTEKVEKRAHRTTVSASLADLDYVAPGDLEYYKDTLETTNLSWEEL